LLVRQCVKSGITEGDAKLKYAASLPPVALSSGQQAEEVPMPWLSGASFDRACRGVNRSG
jgi:hypothetical protein